MTFKVETPLGDFVPGLRAAKAINAMCGDYVETIRRLACYDFATYVAVAAGALNKKPGEVEDKVFAVGMDVLNDPFTVFVASLKNGGRDPELRVAEDANSLGE